ncbi:MAG: ABC transporter permease, partial [Alphaproteobacteria bacterium]
MSPLPVRLARREMRGGLKAFRVFLACLALGVGAIAAVGTTARAIQAALAADARAILGGDVEITLRHRPATEQERAQLERAGTLSLVAEM